MTPDFPRMILADSRMPNTYIVLFPMRIKTGLKVGRAAKVKGEVRMGRVNKMANGGKRAKNKGGGKK